MKIIPFNKPFWSDIDKNYMLDALQNGHISGNGSFTKQAEQLLSQFLDGPGVLLTTSCTHALEMSALLLNISVGDEIIMPSFTFVSTAQAFLLHGAKPVFVDIRPDTLNIDESKIEAAITQETKAIVVVHYAGVACEMDTICKIADENNLSLIEDNAHGLLGNYKDKKLGTFGCLSTLSFHETKNFTCGEGGALVVNDTRLLERAEIIREKGTDRSKFFRGQTDKYTWVDQGSSYVISDMLAAFLCGQLERTEDIQTVRKRIWETYNVGLTDWAKDNGVSLPTISEECQQTYHMFYILLPSLTERNALLKYLNELGINAVFHYQPLHLSTMYLSINSSKQALQTTVSTSERLLRLPFFYELTQVQQNYIIEKINNWKAQSTQ